MPKMKSRSTVKKRFERLPGGLVKRTTAFKRKKLTNKTAKRKRQLRGQAYVDVGQERTIKQLLPNR